MATYTATPVDSSATPIPMSSVVPFGGNTTTPVEGGPTNANSGNPVAPVSMYVKDGNDLTLGLTTQTKATDGSATSWSVIQLLKGIIDKLLNTVAVTQSGTWTVQPGNTPNTSAWLVQDVVASTGGSTPYRNLSAASTNSTNVKAVACQMYGYAISNTNAAARYVKFYDKATAPTIGTDTPKHTIEIPANGVVIRAFPEGMKFANGFGWGTTTGVADTDTGAVGLNDLVIDFSLNS